MTIRKQVYDLQPQDLDKYPVWEFALDEEGEEEQDEATVRPVKRRLPVDPSYGMQVVSAEFKLADGTEMIGYLTPPPNSKDNDLGTTQPVIVTEDGQVPFWCGVIKPKKKDLQRYYSILERSAKDTFPIAFESTVPIIDGPVAGRLDGFIILDDWKSGKISILK